MTLQVTIYDITGQTPYDIYICQGDGTGCFYMATISTVPYVFDIPSPYNSSTQYMLKVIDNNGCVITGIEDVTTCPTATPTSTPTNTPTVTTTPSNTPTNTSTPSNTPTNTSTPSNTPTNTPTVTNTPTLTKTPTNTPTLTKTPTNTPTLTKTPTNTPTPTKVCIYYRIKGNMDGVIYTFTPCCGETRVSPFTDNDAGTNYYICSSSGIVVTNGTATVINQGACPGC